MPALRYDQLLEDGYLVKKQVIEFKVVRVEEHGPGICLVLVRVVGGMSVVGNACG